MWLILNKIQLISPSKIHIQKYLILIFKKIQKKEEKTKNYHNLEVFWSLNMMPATKPLNTMINDKQINLMEWVVFLSLSLSFSQFFFYILWQKQSHCPICIHLQTAFSCLEVKSRIRSGKKKYWSKIKWI